MPDFGPFSVAAQQITALGGAHFGQFVTRLLSTEAAAHEMTGTVLETTYQENVGDGGVDAGLRHASATPWIPAGDSAWQFKAGDLGPAKCKEELAGATKALETLRNGGAYRLVLGATLTSAKIDRRRTELVAKAVELGIANAAQVIDVISADGLARWAEQYPAMAVSPVLRGNVHIGQTFDEWARSNRHVTAWVSSEDRDAQIEAVRSVLLGGDQLDIHLDGVSGLGKTRLVLEALRGQQYEAVVVYAPAADTFPVTVLNQLQSQGRTGVVVIDECDRKQHEIYASVLHGNSTLRLVTIGEPGGNTTRTPMISLERFSDEAMSQLLEKNEPQLWPEAARVVVEVAAGNIDYALKAARALLASGTGSAGRLVTGEDVRSFITEQLPDGTFFLACCALALFSRFGYDGDVSDDLTKIADGLGFEVAELRAAASALQRRGLLSKQGRYRSVAPHPVAVYLASQGWAEFGQRIITDLLPLLDPDLVERLFRRAVDLGELATTSSAVEALLSSTGPLATLTSLAEKNNSRLLVHFAVLAPSAIADRLATLVGPASDDELRQQQSIRRDLVWTLEKLAWHSRTFETAADTLLRLATAEIETFSNNASGTWVELFGTMLPGTAASPEERAAYLQCTAKSRDPRVRLLAVKGAARALTTHESIMVSGELQGGFVVERRGQPSTYGEAWSYQNDAIDVLAALAADADSEVANNAINQLTEAIHGVLETPAVRDHLGRAIATLPGSVVSLARIAVDSLRSLFGRVDVQDTRPEGLEIFESLLPPEPAADHLLVVAHSDTWGRSVEEVAGELTDAARAVNSTSPEQVLLDLISSEAIPAAYSVGRALAGLGLGPESVRGNFVALLDGPNAEAVVGFLNALVDSGETGAYDSYVDEQEFGPLRKLELTVRGPRTERAIKRVDQLVEEVSVSQAARVLFSWMYEATEAHIARYLGDWLDRIVTQDDYNAAVDFVAMHALNKDEPLELLDPLIRILVAKRAQFPETGSEGWDWTQLAKRQLKDNPEGLAGLLADLIEAQAMSAYSRSEESRLFQRAVLEAGEPAWTDLMSRLERKSWRLSFSVRDWLAGAVEPAVAKRWVGDSIERARILADVTTVTGSELSPVVRFLLDRFGRDQQVTSALASQFTSGSWVGDESIRVARQIAQVEGWLADRSLSDLAKDWARKLQRSLERWHAQVLEREAEGDW